MDKFSSRYTPIDDDDPECDQTHVTLCIYNVDPDLITKMLEVEPTFAQKIGVIRTMPSGSKGTGRINSWLLSSRSWFPDIPDPISSKDVRTHLDWLLNTIEPSISQLLELQQLPDVKMSIRCSWWSNSKDFAGFALWPEQMEIMAKLNLECLLEITTGYA
jgi:hypothetical protein